MQTVPAVREYLKEAWSHLVVLTKLLRAVISNVTGVLGLKMRYPWKKLRTHMTASTVPVKSVMLLNLVDAECI